MSPKAPTLGEYSFQSLCPGHGRTAFFWRFVLPNSFSSAFAASCRRHQNPVLAVWSEYAVTNSPGANLDSFSWPA